MDRSSLHLEVSPDCIDQCILSFLLLAQSLHDLLINRALCDNMMNDDRILLTLAMKSRICLLIQLQTPCKTKPDKCGPTGLKIKAVTRRSRMDDCRRNLSRIPIFNILRGLNLSNLKSGLYSLCIMLIRKPSNYTKAMNS